MTTDPWLALYGLAGYAGTVSLLVVWIGIALSHARVSKQWWLLAVGLCFYALLFVGLTMVASEAPFINRTVNMIVNRTITWLGLTCVGAFTWHYLKLAR